MSLIKTRTRAIEEEPLKMKLQFFAEPGDSDEQKLGADTGDGVDAPPDDDGKDESLTPEALLARIQALEADNAKLKRDKDKASTDAADWKKKYNATLTDAQIAAQQKADKEAEREETFKKLLRENEINKLTKNFMKLNYPEDKAEEAAAAQYDGDTDSLFRIQSEVQQNLIKTKEQEWIKSRPQADTGAGDEEEDAFLKGFLSVGDFARKRAAQQH